MLDTDDVQNAAHASLGLQRACTRADLGPAMSPTPPSDYDAWLADLSTERIRDRFLAIGCQRVLVKELANDNSKNQVYLGKEIGQVGLIPTGEFEQYAGTSQKPLAGGPIFQAPVTFVWLGPNGTHVAPHTKLIYYPQYPEVRLSGFLLGCEDAPRSLLVRELRGTERGRLLLLGIHESGRVYGLVLPPEASARNGVTALATEPYGVFQQWRLSGLVAADPRRDLLNALCRVHMQGWHPGQKLSAAGRAAYKARNAGGYTLESLLGVSANGVAEPDFAGWEVKSHSVGSDFHRPSFGPVTLLTPEPDGGAYSTGGVVDFMLKYGYESTRHENRRDYAGTQRNGDPTHPRCGTRIVVEGFDPSSGAIQSGGQIALRDGQDDLAASWSFSKLLTHWKAKHAQTVYVPTIARPAPAGGNEYHFGSEVLLGEGTTFSHLLAAFTDGTVYYDPGTNMVQSPAGKWTIGHRRNQFRSKWADLDRLYERTVSFKPAQPFQTPQARPCRQSTRRGPVLGRLANDLDREREALRSTDLGLHIGTKAWATASITEPRRCCRTACRPECRSPGFGSSRETPSGAHTPEA